jgi:hypothetical protein
VISVFAGCLANHDRAHSLLTKSGNDSVVHRRLNSLSGNNSISVLEKKVPKPY